MNEPLVCGTVVGCIYIYVYQTVGDRIIIISVRSGLNYGERRSESKSHELVLVNLGQQPR